MESDDKYLIDHDMSVDGYLTTMIKINFSDHIAESHVYMHSRYETIHEIYSRRGILSINHKQPENIKINYKKTLVKLIQKPYSTACVIYKQFGYNLRSDCIFKCKTNFHKKELNSWPGFTRQLIQKVIYLWLKEKIKVSNWLQGKNVESIAVMKVIVSKSITFRL
jgi:hypothetical protein